MAPSSDGPIFLLILVNLVEFGCLLFDFYYLTVSHCL